MHSDLFFNSFNLPLSVSVTAILGLRVRIINIIDTDELKEMFVGQMWQMLTCYLGISPGKAEKMN